MYAFYGTVCIVHLERVEMHMLKAKFKKFWEL